MRRQNIGGSFWSQYLLAQSFDHGRVVEKLVSTLIAEARHETPFH